MSAPFVVHIDPTPIPAKKAAENMGVTVETLILRHARGEFPALFKNGRRWYVNPQILLQLGHGDTDEGRKVEGDMGGPAGQAEAVLQPDKRGTRGDAKSSGRPRSILDPD